ncbi:MAG: hypothetical protein ACYDCI_06770 [Candidatus Limnocylindrales bacterium]
MDLPDIGRYRRRYIVEFGPEDAGLVDRMGVAHRTKRAAIIAGLRLLDSGEIERLRAQVAGLEPELDRAQGALAAAQTTAKASTPKLDKARADLADERIAHRRTQKQLGTAQSALKEAQASLTRAQTEAAGLRAERDHLASLLPHHAYCGHCDKLVAESEWAEQPTLQGIDVYHEPDGYRAKSGLIGGSATVLLQRRSPGQVVR